jgi:hypothetical protein
MNDSALYKSLQGAVNGNPIENQAVVFFQIGMRQSSARIQKAV